MVILGISKSGSLMSPLALFPVYLYQIINVISLLIGHGLFFHHLMFLPWRQKKIWIEKTDSPVTLLQIEVPLM
jgi:hypothetical protein